MSAHAPDVADAVERLSDEVTRPFPASRKIHVTGSRDDLRVLELAETVGAIALLAAAQAEYALARAALARAVGQAVGQE